MTSDHLLRNDQDRSQKACVQRLKSYLRDVPIGQTATWDDLMEVSGLNRRLTRDAVGRARRQLETEHIVFRNVRDVGYERLDCVGIVEVGKSDVLRGLRHGKRTLQRGDAVDVSAVGPDLAAQHTVRMSTIALFVQNAHGNSINARAKRLIANEKVEPGALDQAFRATRDRTTKPKTQDQEKEECTQ